MQSANDEFRDNLLINDAGRIALETLADLSLSQKIDYAWQVYQSADEQYSAAHKIGAIEFLRRQFQIPNSEPLKELEYYIAELIKLKTDLHVVTFPEQFCLKPLTSIHMTKKADQFFMNAVNQDIKVLNQLIKSYNEASSKVERIEKLKLIYKHYLQIQNDYSAKQIANCSAFQTEILGSFFSQLLKQVKINGLASITSLDSSPIQIDDLPNAAILSNLIANMPQEKLSLLQQALSTGNFSILLGLYSADEPENASLRNFLGNNTIETLGGGNSKNYKIKPNDGSPPFVLKLENRMSLPKALEIHLRESLPKHYFTKLSVSRQSYLPKAKGKAEIRNIEVGEFCANDNLENYGLTITESPITSALQLFTQMAEIVEAIRIHGCAFPDMKNTNWLVNHNGQLQIADCKSFVYTLNGNIMGREISHQGYGFITSNHIYPPENRKFSSFPADKMHAFILGKNLYQYLTGCEDYDLIDKNDASQLDFSDVEFSTELGSRLKNLIQALVKSNPLERISVHSALTELQAIQLISLNNACAVLLDEIKQMEEMPESDEFIKHQEELLKKSKNSQEVTDIKHQLEQYITKHQLRDNCIKLLNEFENKEDILYQDLQQKLQACDSDENILIFRKELLDALKPQLYSDCQILLKQLQQLNQEPIYDSHFLTLYDKLEDASTNLYELREDLAYFYQYSQCKHLIQAIKALGLGDEDTIMNAFIEKQNQKLNSPLTSLQISNLKKQLDTTFQRLNNPVFKEIKDQINKLSEGFMSLGSSEKAQRIARAFIKLDIAERMQINDPKQRETLLKDVLKQMASHRHPGKTDVYLTAEGNIDEKHAAATYRDFKQKLQNITKEQQQLEESKLSKK